MAMFLVQHVGITAGMVIIVYLFMFFLGNVIGYAFEVLFRRFVSAGKWVNPGFMRGPWLPLYGFGLVLMLTMVMLIVGNLPSDMLFYNPWGNMVGHIGEPNGATVNDLIPISLMWISLIVLEFIAGIIFVKGFKIKLWDYSNMKGNILGVICPQFSVVWLIAAVVYYYALSPFVLALFQNMFGYMFGSDGAVAHFSFIFVLGIIYGVFFLDLANSLGVFTRIAKMAKKRQELVAYEAIIQQKRAELKRKRQELLTSILPEGFGEKVEENKRTAKEKTGRLFEKVRRLMLIDPDKKKTDNYDSSGRPIKDEEADSEGEERS